MISIMTKRKLFHLARSTFMVISFILLVVLILDEEYYGRTKTHIIFQKPENQSDICPIRVNMNADYKSLKEKINRTDLLKRLSSYEINPGGSWSPKNCKPPYKLAIIIPYRDREKNLNILLNNIHPFLINQNTYYTIYLVEPEPDLNFNKGVLMNSAFLEAQKIDDYDCFIFHDVDMIPENDKVVYNCSPLAPKLIASNISSFNYTNSKYFNKVYFGGVTAFTKEQFFKINGFSNVYFGWGGEDDDVHYRIMSRYRTSIKESQQIGVFYAIPHKISKRNKERVQLLRAAFKRMSKDGVKSIYYRVSKIEKTPLFTRIVIWYDSESTSEIFV